MTTRSILSLRPNGARRNPTDRPERGFTLVEIITAVVLIGILSVAVVLGISNLTSKGGTAACTTSLDAARTGSNVYFAGANVFPTTLLQMTSAAAPSVQLASGVTLDPTGMRAIGNGWTLTMTPGVGAAAPTFACSNTASTPGTSNPAPTSAAVTTTITPTTITPTTTSLGGTAACPGTYPGVVGEYYANQFLTGAPAMCRDDQAIAFNWGNAGPGGGLPIFRFSARWTQNVVFISGAHTFTLTSDDGSRLFVDGTQVIDWWSDHTYTSKTVTMTLAAGPHTIVVEYYQYYGAAQIALTWT